jgi:hypothetical protein
LRRDTQLVAELRTLPSNKSSPAFGNDLHLFVAPLNENDEVCRYLQIANLGQLVEQFFR